MSRLGMRRLEVLIEEMSRSDRSRPIERKKRFRGMVCNSGTGICKLCGIITRTQTESNRASHSSEPRLFPQRCKFSEGIFMQFTWLPMNR